MKRITPSDWLAISKTRPLAGTNLVLPKRFTNIGTATQVLDQSPSVSTRFKAFREMTNSPCRISYATLVHHALKHISVGSVPRNYVYSSPDHHRNSCEFDVELMERITRNLGPFRMVHRTMISERASDGRLLPSQLAVRFPVYPALSGSQSRFLESVTLGINLYCEDEVRFSRGDPVDYLIPNWSMNLSDHEKDRNPLHRKHRVTLENSAEIFA